MARRCKMSVRSFHRKFVTVHGVTPCKFLQLKRIERVQAQLRTSRKSLEQILAEVGVSDVASFRRVFRRELGYSPAEYRRRLPSRKNADCGRRDRPVSGRTSSARARSAESRPEPAR
ncbi:MAG TPA: helix-turn-helix domain-containing protein [Steroidobacter sp.]